MNEKLNKAQVPDRMTLIGVRDLEVKFGMTRNVFYPQEKAGEFPRRIPVSHNHVCYRITDIEEWLDVLQAGGKWSEHVAAKAAEAANAEPENAPRAVGGV